MTGHHVAISERLAALEAIIQSGLRTFIEVGQALSEIQHGRLYREQGFATFAAYCQKRWGWGRAHAYRLIDAAQVSRNLSPTGDSPMTERQARELASLPPEQQREVAASLDFGRAPRGHDAASRIRYRTGEVAGDERQRTQSRARPSVARFGAF